MLNNLIHPWLFGLYPAVWLFSNNLHQALLTDLVVPFAVIIPMTFVLVKVLHKVSGNILLSSSFVAVSYLFIFAYGPVRKMLAQAGIPGISGYPIVISVALIILLLAVLIILWKKRENVVSVSRYLRYMSFFLFCIPALTISQYYLFKGADSSVNRIKNNDNEITADKKSGLPDIYFIILDRYAGADTLAGKFGYDNSDFLDFLRGAGFYVSDKSWANYHSTAHSLASTLNFSYLQDTVNIRDEKDPDWKAIYSLIQNHRVGTILRQSGYKYYHFGSWWWPTTKNNNADINLNLGLVSEFTGNLISNTVFFPFLEKYNIPLIDTRFSQFRRVNFQFEKLMEIPKIKDDTFVFVHFIIPHEPFIFEEDGGFLNAEKERSLPLERKYIDQVKFLNSRLEKFVKTVLNTNPDSIIILQSDEGPYPERYEKNKKTFDWANADRSEIEMKMSILNAVYLPDRDYALYDKYTTPVNTFRLIFNKLLSANLEYLPEKYYAGNTKYPFNLLEITK